MNDNTKQNHIGWREWVAIPELNIPAIKAKIDTGAKTSALHAYQIERYSKNSSDFVRFWIHPLQHSQTVHRECESRLIDSRPVKDSGGHVEDRFFIESTAMLGNQKWTIEISLTNREDMMFRMLLGRTALIGGNFIVNPAKSYIHGKALETAYQSEED